MLKIKFKFCYSNSCLQYRLFHLEEDRFSTLSDDELDAAVRSLMMGNRLIGANAVLTRLRNIGVHMQRERVRQSLRRVDPAGVAIRSRRAAKSRVYRVAGPNSFWHLDGNHKLIRYVCITHAVFTQNYCTIIHK